jgi:hypothetical protein
MNEVRTFIRLAVKRELTEDEIRTFYEFVDDLATVAETSAFEEDGSEIDDVVVTMYNVDDTFMYEVAVAEVVDIDTSREIGQDLMSLIDDDFELDVESV